MSNIAGKIWGSTELILANSSLEFHRIDYKKEKLNNINKYFEVKLGTVLRAKANNNIPTNSTLDQKNSNYFGKLTNSFNDNFSLNYEFSVDNSLSKLEYNSIGTTISKNNFVTTFNYIEENGAIGSSNILENTTSFNFDEQNFPREFYLKIDSKESFEARLNYSKIVLNKRLKFSFKIPNSYAEVK